VVVFNRNRMPNGHQIREYAVRDMQGKDLCSAKVQAVQQIGNTTVPYKLQLEWPAEKLKLNLQFNKPSLNSVTPEQAQHLFVRQPLQGVRSFDLAGGARPASYTGQLQQAGGIPRDGRISQR
jgi:hypothetical protein